MKFQHTDGETAPSRKSLNDGRQVAVEAGVFEVDPCSDELRDRLVAAGHVPLDDTATADDAVKDDVQEADDNSADDEDGDVDVPAAGEFTEQQLVDDLDYREKQAIAGQYGHISGNESEEKLTEELIKQRREEVEN